MSFNITVNIYLVGRYILTVRTADLYSHCRANVGDEVKPDFVHVYYILLYCIVLTANVTTTIVQ